MIFTSQTRFREAFYKENMITAIVRRLVTDNEELQGYSANAIFKVSLFSDGCQYRDLIPTESGWLDSL